MNAQAETREKISLGIAHFRSKELEFQLAELCHKFEIAGSVRRKEPYVKDIEIVCIPKIEPMLIEGNLFPVDSNQVIHWIEKPENSNVEVIKGGSKYYQFKYQNSVVVDLFMTTAEEFGRMLAIRTGPENYSKKMASRWVELGWHGKDGKLYNAAGTGEQAEPFYTEQEFFEFLGWTYVKPEARK